MQIWLWIGFLGFVILMLALDLGVFNKNAHVVKVKEALGWTAFWVALAMIFNLLIYYMYENHLFDIGLQVGHQLSGSQAALQFFTGYVIEKSLSMDNIFVIAMIFSYFKVPSIYQHRVLFWGILGALIMRGAMILGGVALIEEFNWMTYFFGGILILTAVKMLVTSHDNLEPDKNILVKMIRKFYPVSENFESGNFFTKINNKKAITPLFLVLLVIESTDVLFAIDSIPAIFAITTDPFIIFTSNVFAILGLRSLYFALAAMMDKFRFLKISLVFVLAFVGSKMILVHNYQIPTLFSLTVIIGILSVGIIASIYASKKDSAKFGNH